MGKKRIIFILAVVLCLSINAFAQDATPAQIVEPLPLPVAQTTRPAWVNAVENDLRQNETWKLERKSERSARDYFEYNFELKNGRLLTNVQIQILKDATGLEKRFSETVENLTNGMGRFSTRTRLAGLGQQAFKWVNVNKDGWTMIRFRKSNVFVEIFSLSEEAAPIFAATASENIPQSQAAE